MMQADAVAMIVDSDNQIAQVVGFPIEWTPPEESDDGEMHFDFGKLEIPETDWGENRLGWRLILELPIGCFEMDLSFALQHGDTLSFTQGYAAKPMRVCTTRGSFVEAQSEVANADR